MKPNSLLLKTSLLLLFFQFFNLRAVNGLNKQLLKETKKVRFTENKGQVVGQSGESLPNVWFKAEAPGLNLFVTEYGLTYFFLKSEEEYEEHERERIDRKIKWQKVEMSFEGAKLKKENVETEGSSVYVSNYYLAHSPDGIVNVHDLEKVTVKNIYPGIDWILYNSNDKGFKYDFVVHPGADPRQIKMVYKALSAVKMIDDGELLIRTKYGTLREDAPFSYLLESNETIKSSFKLSTSGSGKINRSVVEFNIDENCNNSKTLIIDPQLVWSTFFGGSTYDGLVSIGGDRFGNFFVCGYSSTVSFPLMNANTYFQGSSSPNQFGFISKFTVTGALVWSTFYGGTSSQYAYSVVCDSVGNVFLGGSTSSSNFPVQNAGSYFQGTFAGGNEDGFIVKFDNQGNRLWASYYGGNGNDIVRSLTIDHAGNLWMTGTTTSTTFPLQNGGGYHSSVYSGILSGFLVKFDNAGNRFMSTYYDNCTPQCIAVDRWNNVYITGYSYSLMPVYNPGGTAYFNGNAMGGNDVFILKFDKTGNRRWATYYGNTNTDAGASVICDRNGNVFVAGQTSSTNFPLQNAATYFDNTPGGNGYSDAFILKFDSSCTRQWATFYGGNNTESLSFDNLALDSCQNVYMSFETRSGNLQTLPPCDGGFYDSYLDTTIGNNLDIAITKFTNNGTLLWATFVGGSGADFRSPLLIDINGDLVMGGEWANANASTYPLVNPGGNAYVDHTFNGTDDSYIVKFHSSPLTTQSFSYNSPACSNDTSDIFPQTSNIFTGGTFSSSPGLTINPQNGNITPSLSAGGIYTVTYQNASSCYCGSQSTNAAVTATVQILPAPVLSASPGGTVCQGALQTLTVGGAVSYLWSTGSTAQSITVQPASNASFTVSGTNNAGCTSSVAISLNVVICTSVPKYQNSDPAIHIWPNPSRGDLTINSDAAIKFIILNTVGQQLYEGTLNKENNFSSTICGLAKGIYLISTTGSGASQVQRVIVD